MNSCKFANYGSWDERTWELHVERHYSPAALEKHLHSIGPSSADPYHDFFARDPYGDFSHYGFTTKNELFSLLKSGVTDTSAVRKVTRLRTAKNTHSVVRETKYDVEGEEVDIPTYLTGAPDYMRDSIRVRKPYRAVRLVIDAGVSSKWTSRQLNEAGLILARLVIALEKAGRSVHLSNFYASVDRSARKVWLMSCDVKRAGTPLNAKKLLMCTHPAFFRGAVFTWIARTSPTRVECLGSPLNSFITRQDQTLRFIKDHVYREKDMYLLRLIDVLNMISESDKGSGWEDQIVRDLIAGYVE